MSKPQLTYFGSRGICEPIRLLLADAQVDYVNTEIPRTGAEFEALKASGVLDFAALPLWEEDGLKLVQSNTILRHLARVYGYNGDNEAEASKIDSVVEGCRDLLHIFHKLLAAPAEAKPALWQEIKDKEFPKWLSAFEAILKRSGTGFVVGKKASYADFFLVSMTEELHVYKLGLEAFPLLDAHVKMIFARPNIAAYAARPRHPYNMSRALGAN